MKSLNQWIVWRLEHREGKEKPTKVPFDPRSGHACNPLAPTNWMTHAAAAATGHSIGFVFTAEDPFFFFDLDDIRSGDTWSEQALRLVARFPGAEVEVSQSGSGLHVFGTYTGTPPAHAKKNKEIGCELYTEKRFVAMGSNAQGDARLDCTAALHTLAAQYFPPREGSSPAEWTDSPREGWTGYVDDDKLIAQALRSGGASAMFGGVGFAQLWKADDAALSEKWPSESDTYDRSSADAALARHLSFWTGADAERIVRLLWRSELVRPKWDRDEYLRLTVSLAVESTVKVYDKPPREAPAVVAEPGARTGYQFMTVDAQVPFFAGCIYVISQNRVMVPDGRVLTQAAFNVSMPSHDFFRDSEAKATTKKPWDALTESHAFECPVADELTFDPAATEVGALVVRSGRAYANTYRPIETPRMAGDASPFLDHLEKLLPDAGDRAILTAYMAAVIQHKGVKFQWCPLIQGVEGNGKTLLTSVLFAAIGERYSHTPIAKDLGSTFNSWMRGKIVIGIEDIYSSGDRRDILEALKPMITNSTLGTMAKGVDQETSRVCCNFIINSNHRDAILKTRGDRRFAVFYTAQQHVEDLARDGMGGSYFPALYAWLRAEGFAVVHDYLASYAIPDAMNPALGHRAPVTTSTEQAIDSSMSALAQDILDMVGEERPGFRGSWISRTMLSQTGKSKVSIAFLRQTLGELGYEPHPGLPVYGQCCRTNRVVQPDERKAELWVVKGSIAARNYTGAGNVATAYEVAQKEKIENVRTG